MTDPDPRASEVLLTALEATTGDRQDRYGHPAVNLGERTADLFSAYVRNMTSAEFNATDVAALMILLKLARLQETPDDFDSLVDIAGYAAAAWRSAE